MVAPRVVGEAIEAVGAMVAHLPPSGPDIDPIEAAFSAPKALLRKVARRNIAAPWSTIGDLFDVFSPQPCVDVFADAG